MHAVADSAEQYKALRRIAGLLVEERSWVRRAGNRSGREGSTKCGEDELGGGEGVQAGGEEADERTRPDDRWTPVPWPRTPEWMAEWLALPHEKGAANRAEEEDQRRAIGMARQVEGGDGRGHAVVVVGPFAYCARCGNFARRRLGAGLKGICAAPQHKTRNAVAARLRRLREGKHPITG